MEHFSPKYRFGRVEQDTTEKKLLYGREFTELLLLQHLLVNQTTSPHTDQLKRRVGDLIWKVNLHQRLSSRCGALRLIQRLELELMALNRKVTLPADDGPMAMGTFRNFQIKLTDQEFHFDGLRFSELADCMVYFRLRGFAIFLRNDVEGDRLGGVLLVLKWAPGRWRTTASY